MSEHESPCWYDDQISFMPDLDSPKQNSQSTSMPYNYPYSCKKELDLQYPIPQEHFLQLPLLAPKLLQTPTAYDHHHRQNQDQQIQQTRDHNLNLVVYGNHISIDNEQAVDQLTDWRALDKFVASQLSQDDNSKESNYSNEANMFSISDHTNILVRHLNKQEMGHENASTSASSCPIDLWK